MSIRKTTIVLTLSLFLTACATPEQNKQLAYTGGGAAAGAATASLLGADSAITFMTSLMGGALGYYYATMPAPKEPELQKVKHVGGYSFQVGDSITIVIPVDAIFRPATTTYEDRHNAVLADLATYMRHYPQKDILVTVSTGNIGSKKFEDKLSEDQAKKIVNYLHIQGVGDTSGSRELRYAGLGSRQPIASTRSAKGINENRRVQITLYQTKPNTQFDQSLEHANIGRG